MHSGIPSFALAYRQARRRTSCVDRDGLHRHLPRSLALVGDSERCGNCRCVDLHLSRSSKVHLAVLALVLVGCALVVRAYDPAILRISWLGAIVGLLIALTHTVYVLAGQRNALSISPWATLAYTMTFGSLTLLALALAADQLAPDRKSVV